MKTSLSSVWPPAVMDQEFTSQIEADAASHPEWADLQNRLGLLRWAEGDLEGAIVAFEDCLNLNPRYSWASLNMAGCLATKGEFSKARAAIIDAADPVEGAKAVTEGWIALLDGRPETAEAAIRRIPPRRRELANVLWLRAATAENRDPAEGASMWRTVLEEPTIKAWYGEIDELRTPREPGERRGGLFPGFGKLWLDLSQSYAQLGRFEEAQKMARRSYLFWSERGDFLHHQGVLCQLQGNETQALQCWTEALDAAPEDSRSATALSFYYSRVGNLDAAMQHVEIAIDRSPGYADLHRQRGLLAAALGDDEVALSAFERALQINPLFHGAQVELAHTLFRLERWEESVTVYERIEELGIRSSDLSLHAGRCWEKLESFEKAAACYEAAISQEGSEAMAHYRLGMVYRALGKKDEAKSSWRKFLTFNDDPKAAATIKNLMDGDQFSAAREASK